MMDWSDFAEDLSLVRCQNAFNKLIGNLHQPMTDFVKTGKMSDVYITQDPVWDNNLYWKITMPKGQVRNQWDPSELIHAPMATFKIIIWFYRKLIWLRWQMVSCIASSMALPKQQAQERRP